VEKEDSIKVFDRFLNFTILLLENDDEAYERALQESMKDYDKMEEEEEGKEEEENKFKAFQGTGVSLASTVHRKSIFAILV